MTQRRIHGLPSDHPNSKLLRVTIQEAKDLSDDLFGSTDSFVEVTLCKKNDENSVIDQVKTHTIKKNSNPVYNVDFVFNISPNDHKLIFDVKNENRLGRNQTFGRVTLRLDQSSTIIPNRRELDAFKKIDFPFENNSEGKLNLMIHYLALEQTVDDDGLPLPPGWERGSNKDGRIFYVDHVNKRTTWVRPRLNNQISSSDEVSKRKELGDFLLRYSLEEPAQTQSSSAKETPIGPLPPGWDQKRHKNGRIFYIDHNRKHTQWEDPRLQKLPGSADITTNSVNLLLHLNF